MDGKAENLSSLWESCRFEPPAEQQIAQMCSSADSAECTCLAAKPPLPGPPLSPSLVSAVAWSLLAPGVNYKPGRKCQCSSFFTKDWNYTAKWLWLVLLMTNTICMTQVFSQFSCSACRSCNEQCSENAAETGWANTRDINILLFAGELLSLWWLSPSFGHRKHSDSFTKSGEKKINPLSGHNNKLFFRLTNRLRKRKTTVRSWTWVHFPGIISDLRLSPICAEDNQVAQNQVLQDETHRLWLFLKLHLSVF